MNRSFNYEQFISFVRSGKCLLIKCIIHHWCFFIHQHVYLHLIRVYTYPKKRERVISFSVNDLYNNIHPPLLTPMLKPLWYLLHARFQQNMVTYQNLITQSMYDKQLDSGIGTLLHLCDDVIQQEVHSLWAGSLLKLVNSVTINNLYFTELWGYEYHYVLLPSKS